MELHSWGANSYGQLGVNHKEDILLPTKAICPPRCLPIKEIYAGGGHTLILSESGEVWSSGWNSTGQLGLDHRNDVHKLQLVKSLKERCVTKLACGWDFTLILTDDKNLYVCGSNSFGQLGHSVEKSSILLSLEDSPCLKNIIDVAAGLRHSIVLTADGDVLTFGNGKRGQLGHGGAASPAKHHIPEKVTFEPGYGPVVQVIAGAYHSAALTETGEVMFWGYNKYGQGAQSADDPIEYNSPVTICSSVFDGKKVVKLFSGWTHLLALTEDNCLYSWGRADYGQLGRPVSGTCDPKPRPIPGLNVKQLCCGSEHNLALLDSGEVASWGWNEHGICGSGDEENVVKPVIVSAFKDFDVTNIGCGGGHSFVVCKKR